MAIVMRGLFLLLLGAVLSGCAYDAPRMQPADTKPRHTAEKGLWTVSEMFEYAIAISGRRVDDATLHDYLQEMSCHVAGPYCPSIRTYPIVAPDFNATMSPNGFMQVWTGLLLRVENESQLAAVLGHEVMHYVERHSLERLETTRRTANLTLAAQVGLMLGGLGAVNSGPVSIHLGDVTNLVAGGYLASYSREHEEQSDREGLKLVSAAGFAPGEAAKVWRNLVAEQEECKLPRPAALLASHPASTDRMAYLERLAAGLPAGDIREQRYLDLILPRRGDWIRHEIAQRRFCRVRVVLERLLEQGANPGELHYFLGEVYRLRNEPDDLQKAIESYRKAVSLPGAPPQAHRELGLVLHRANRPEEARDAFRGYLQAAPGAEDTAMVQRYLGGAG